MKCQNAALFSVKVSPVRHRRRMQNITKIVQLIEEVLFRRIEAN